MTEETLTSPTSNRSKLLSTSGGLRLMMWMQTFVSSRRFNSKQPYNGLLDPSPGHSIEWRLRALLLATRLPPLLHEVIREDRKALV